MPFIAAGPSTAGFEEAWGEAASGPAGPRGAYQGPVLGHHGPMPGDQAAHFEEFERIYGAPASRYVP